MSVWVYIELQKSWLNEILPHLSCRSLTLCCDTHRKPGVMDENDWEPFLAMAYKRMIRLLAAEASGRLGSASSSAGWYHWMESSASDFEVDTVSTGLYGSTWEPGGSGALRCKWEWKFERWMNQVIYSFYFTYTSIYLYLNPCIPLCISFSVHMSVYLSVFSLFLSRSLSYLLLIFSVAPHLPLCLSLCASLPLSMSLYISPSSLSYSSSPLSNTLSPFLPYLPPSPPIHPSFPYRSAKFFAQTFPFHFRVEAEIGGIRLHGDVQFRRVLRLTRHMKACWWIWCATVSRVRLQVDGQEGVHLSKTNCPHSWNSE